MISNRHCLIFILYFCECTQWKPNLYCYIALWFPSQDPYPPWSVITISTSSSMGYGPSPLSSKQGGFSLLKANPSTQCRLCQPCTREHSGSVGTVHTAERPATQLPQQPPYLNSCPGSPLLRTSQRWRHLTTVSQLGGVSLSLAFSDTWRSLKLLPQYRTVLYTCLCVSLPD